MDRQHTGREVERHRRVATMQTSRYELDSSRRPRRRNIRRIYQTKFSRHPATSHQLLNCWQSFPVEFYFAPRGRQRIAGGERYSVNPGDEGTITICTPTGCHNIAACVFRESQTYFSSKTRRKHNVPINLGDKFGRVPAACVVFCGTPLGCGFLLNFRFRGVGGYASPPAILCAAVGGRGIAAFSFFNSRRVQSHDCGSVIYRNPSTNGFFLSAGSPCGKRSKQVESDQWITGYSISSA